MTLPGSILTTGDFPETLFAEPLERRLFDLTLGNSVVQALYVVAELDIAGQLANGPQEYHALAASLEIHADGLYRVLRFLARLEIFVEVETGHFALTPLAEPLRANHPHSLREYLLFRGAEAYNAVGALLHCLKTGESGFRKCYGVDRPEYLRRHPHRAQLFSSGMSVGTEMVDEKLVTAYDFSAIQTLVYLGGLDRTHILAILQHYPALRCIFWDQAPALENIRQRLSAAGVAERCELRANTGAELPSADAYLASTMHRYNDDQASAILRRCRAVMRNGARLLMIEKVVNPHMPWSVLENDLTMLVSTGVGTGRLRSLEEFVAVLTRAGLRLERCIALDAAFALLEAIPDEGSV